MTKLLRDDKNKKVQRFGKILQDLGDRGAYQTQ